MVVTVLPTAEAELWEFVIISNVENKSIVSGDTVVISGQVVDHAYKPTEGQKFF